MKEISETCWKRMWSGDHPGLQNRRAAGNPVTGAFDSHTLPPFIFFSNYVEYRCVAESLGARTGLLL
jgi:hypothetical protein